MFCVYEAWRHVTDVWARDLSPTPVTRNSILVSLGAITAL